jgi:hypothetical protein
MEIPLRGTTDIAGLVVLASTIIVLIYFHQRLQVEHDPREPPLIRHAVPYIGHLIGIVRHGPGYLGLIKLVTIESTTK